MSGIGTSKTRRRQQKPDSIHFIGHREAQAFLRGLSLQRLGSQKGKNAVPLDKVTLKTFRQTLRELIRGMGRRQSHVWRKARCGQDRLGEMSVIIQMTRSVLH